MAKYQVKMSCGHVETIVLFGKNTDRKRRIAWLEEHGTCSACYKAQCAAANAAAREESEKDNLPALTGSAKQIDWAMSIRVKIITGLDKMFDDSNSKTADDQIQGRNRIYRQAVRNVLITKTDSRFWIDNRDYSVRGIVALVKAEVSAELDKLSAEAEKVIDADVDDYVVSTDAQQVAIAAETELAAQAANDADLDDYAVSTDAQQVAIAAETDLAMKAVNDADLDDYAVSTDAQQAAAVNKMKITTKDNAAGRTSAYYINGQRVKKSEIDLHIQDAARAGIIIDVDYYTAKQFRAITRSPYNLKVVFGHVYGKCLMTEAAATDLGATIVKRFTGFNGLKVYEVEMPTTTEANVDDYAVSTDAQQAAIDAETELAAQAANDADLDDYAVSTDAILALPAIINIAEYNALNLWAEKVSNGQRDAVTQIITHVKKWFNAEAVKADVLTAIDTDYINAYHRYLAQYNFLVQDNAGYYHRLYDCGEQCFLKEISTPDAERVKAALVAADTDLAEQAVNDADLDDYAVSTDAQQVAIAAENDLAEQAAALATETHNDPDTNLTANQKLAAQIVAKLGNLIVKCQSGEFGTRHGQSFDYKTYRDEHDEFGTTLFFVEVFTDEENFILDHVNLIKGYGDNKTVETFYFAKPDTTDADEAGNVNTTTAFVQGNNTTTEPNLDDFSAQLAALKAERDAAEADFEQKISARKAAEIAEDKAADTFNAAKLAYEKFGKAKASELRKTLLTEDIILADDLPLTTQNGVQLKPRISQIAITFFGDKFKIASMYDVLAYYDTPEQVTAAISQLKAAIKTGAPAYTFPTVEQLNKPPATPSGIRDSLLRAMKIAQQRYADFCHAGQLTLAEHELKLYNICRRAKIQIDCGNNEPPPEFRFKPNLPRSSKSVEEILAEPAEVLSLVDCLAYLNDAAPDGWTITFDGKVYPVKYKGHLVTTLDSLATAKVLPPDKFFAQFKPLVDLDYAPQDQFREDRYRELAELQAMRDALPPDSDRIPILDNLIDQLKRDIANMELVEYDDHGNPIPWF